MLSKTTKHRTCLGVTVIAAKKKKVEGCIIKHNGDFLKLHLYICVSVSQNMGIDNSNSHPLGDCGIPRNDSICKAC